MKIKITVLSLKLVTFNDENELNNINKYTLMNIKVLLFYFIN